MLTPHTTRLLPDDLEPKLNGVNFEEEISKSHYQRDDLEDFIRKPNPYYSDKYYESFRRSLQDPESFWAEVAGCLAWSKPWDKVMDNTDEPFTKWFLGGELNACYNAVDRHVAAGKGDKVALIHDSPVTKSVRKVTYGQLLQQTSLLAGALTNMGVQKGDRVLIYMPLIPETIISMLATVRLGAIHSVVFGGFAARELCTRIDHAEPKIIITASCGVEPTKIVEYKKMLNEGIELAQHKPQKCIVFQRRGVFEADLSPEMDVLWDDALSSAQPHPCVSVEANHPLYILYTSGTTGQPKGIVRPTGGHIATLAWTMKAIYGVSGDDVVWNASDMGWVVGHSYICYGPLCAGLTSVMYEGKPDRTPDSGQYFRVIHDHNVNAIITAPTALRVIRRVDPDARLSRKYSLKSLRYLFVAGEHCDNDTKCWAEQVFKVPILNHWWQTETGHAITASCVGLEHSISPPKYSAGMPFPGYDVRILRPDASECDFHELGRIVVRLPLPPGVMSNLYKSTQRFLELYFTTYPGYYDTMDAGYRDEYGYIFVTARDDDVINVAGHRLSTSALEDVVLSHADVGDAAVVGVPEPTKGEIPLCLFIKRDDCEKSEDELRKEIVRRVRELIGPIAAFHQCASVSGLPRTRSGKTARKSIADLARNKQIKIPSTIEDPGVYKDIILALQSLGYALNAPTPL